MDTYLMNEWPYGIGVHQHLWIQHHIVDKYEYVDQIYVSTNDVVNWLHYQIDIHIQHMATMMMMHWSLIVVVAFASDMLQELFDHYLSNMTMIVALVVVIDVDN